MASYKVPQDVEADDKLLGPFSFRQFVYLMIVLGMVVLGVALFKIFPLLIIIPIPIGLFFLILALPLKKDQPMETYLAAILSFYFKPRKRFWMPGQSESTILITAPKKVEASRVRDITEEEAGHRLSFLSAIVDSEGYAIHSANSSMRDEIYAEAYNTADMFDYSGNARLSSMINREQQARHEEAVKQMRAAIQRLIAILARKIPIPSSHMLPPLPSPNFALRLLGILTPSSSPLLHPPLLQPKPRNLKIWPIILIILSRPSSKRPTVFKEKTKVKYISHYIKELHESTKS